MKSEAYISLPIKRTLRTQIATCWKTINIEKTGEDNLITKGEKKGSFGRSTAEKGG